MTIADLATETGKPVRDVARALGLTWFDSDPEAVAAETLEDLGWTHAEALAAVK